MSPAGDERCHAAGARPIIEWWCPDLKSRSTRLYRGYAPSSGGTSRQSESEESDERSHGMTEQHKGGTEQQNRDRDH